jgi:cellulose synthase operon protein C
VTDSKNPDHKPVSDRDEHAVANVVPRAPSIPVPAEVKRPAPFKPLGSVVAGTSARPAPPPTPSTMPKKSVHVSAPVVSLPDEPELDLDLELEEVLVSVSPPPLLEVDVELKALESEEVLARQPLTPPPVPHIDNNAVEPEPELHDVGRSLMVAPVPLQQEIPEVAVTSTRSVANRVSAVDTLSETTLSLSALDEGVVEDLDVAFRSLELDADNDPEFGVRVSQAPQLTDSVPEDILVGVMSVREARASQLSLQREEMRFSAPNLSEAIRRSISPPLSSELEASILPIDRSVVPEILRSFDPPALVSDGPPAVEIFQDPLEASFSRPPPVAPFALDVDIAYSDEPEPLLDFEEPLSEPPPSVLLEAPDETAIPTVSSEKRFVEAPSESISVAVFTESDPPETETELLIEEDAEIEFESVPADRGAMLAASVTSRRKRDDNSDRLYAVDPRAEASARAALLLDVAENESPAKAAELLALAADLLDGAEGDRERARTTIARARSLSPSAMGPLRLQRRFAIADGDLRAALALCDEELSSALGDTEKTETLLLAGELAASIEGTNPAKYWSQVDPAGVSGIVARLLSSGFARDKAALSDALGSFASQATGVLSASVDVARARLMEGGESQGALTAIRDAVAQDPSDAGAWFAMARIGISMSNSALFREGLTGVSRVGDGVASTAADALRRALDGVLGDPVAPGNVADATVSGWLVAHAQRDSGGDASAQVNYGVANTQGESREAWVAWVGDGDGGRTGRALALKKAFKLSVEESATRASGLFDGGAAGAIEAGLRARSSSMDASESEALQGGGEDIVMVRNAIMATTRGIDALEATAKFGSQDVWHSFARAMSAQRAGHVDDIRLVYARIATEERDAGALTWARRAMSLLGESTEQTVQYLRLCAEKGKDSRRTAGNHLLAAAYAAADKISGGGRDAVTAAKLLPGDLAAAEIAALYALRGDASVTAIGTDLLEQASGGDGAAQRVAAVRASLRRVATDPKAAAESVWKAWQRVPGDASLGALVLRTPRVHERAVTVAKSLAEVAWASGRERPDAAIAAGSFLSMVLEWAGRYADAAQALSRTRTWALHDRSLEIAEERLWLRAGMYAEAIERSFDRLNGAVEDFDRVAAYERLAEIDRSHRGQTASAVLSLQEILSLLPGHKPSLHTLLRFFTEQGRHNDSLDIYLRLAKHTNDQEDALALAHMGARIASLQAEGDPLAGVQHQRAVWNRGFRDGRLRQAMEMDARRQGDHKLLAEVLELHADATTDALTRSIYLCHAAQGRECMDDHARAMALHVRAVDAEPTHVLARWGAAWALEHSGDYGNAAEMFEAAGRYASAASVGAWSFAAAARLWDTKVGERTRALAAYREVLERDATHRTAFDAALAIVRAAGDTPGELDLLERYGHEVGGDVAASLAQHVRAAQLAEASGDLPRAFAQWRDAFALAPESPDVLRPLVRVASASSKWSIVVDATIRLVKITKVTTERAELLYSLGEVLHDHMNDAKRAEVAWRRGIAESSRDVRILARLLELYRKTGDLAREADTLQTLVVAIAPGPERIEGLLRLANLAELSLNDPKRAQAALEAARRDSPGDLKVLRALRGFHSRNGDMEQFVAFADKAIVDVHRAVDLNLRDLPLMERLSEVLEIRGYDDASHIAAAVAVSLGSLNDRVRALAFDGAVKGLGSAALAPEVVALLCPPSVGTALRGMLATSAEVIERVMPFDLKTLGAELLGERPHPMRSVVDDLARELGMPPVTLYVAGSVSSVCVPIGSAPPALLLQKVVEDTPATRFAVARSLLMVSLGLVMAVRFLPSDLALLIGGLLRQYDPMYRIEGLTDQRELMDIAAKIARLMPRDLLAEVGVHADEVLRTGVRDVELIRSGALEFGNRMALMLTGDIAGGIALLSPPAMTASAAVELVPDVGRLVQVALSDRFMEARRLAGADGAPAV